jgi:hypothetical protein
MAKINAKAVQIRTEPIEPSPDLDNLVAEFDAECKPLESGQLRILSDGRTGARYCECHLQASVLSLLATVDVPLDPESQAQYRANRKILTDDPSFHRMQEDAKKRRSFSNIVAEYTRIFDPKYPIKIVGGQHRFKAIQGALQVAVDEIHGVKVYFGLDKRQRLDVQLISNTNIAISRDLFDRLQETFVGPQLRDWCHKVGLLPPGADFSGEKRRGDLISVKMAKTFITNYLSGKKVPAEAFATTNTTPVICASGEQDKDWEELKDNTPDLWVDSKLQEAGAEFSRLAAAQQQFFKKHSGKKRVKADYQQKAYNLAVLSAWPYVAGLLHNNEPRLKRHFALRNTTGKDPLNAQALTAGRHHADATNYRGLGSRTDPRERGRFVELFYLQAESGKGITPKDIRIAISDHYLKQAGLEAIKERER